MAPNLKLIFVAAAALALVAVQAEIRSTAILFRHGERTPADAVPNIQCSIIDDIGLGQLTNVSGD